MSFYVPSISCNRNHFPSSSSSIIFSCIKMMNLERRTENDGSFHFAISRILLLGNFVGFPIIGIFSRDISNIGFKWMSIR